MKAELCEAFEVNLSKRESGSSPYWVGSDWPFVQESPVPAGPESANLALVFPWLLSG